MVALDFDGLRVSAPRRVHPSPNFASKKNAAEEKICYACQQHKRRVGYSLTQWGRDAGRCAVCVGSSQPPLAAVLEESDGPTHAVCLNAKGVTMTSPPDQRGQDAAVKMCWHWGMEGGRGCIDCGMRECRSLRYLQLSFLLYTRASAASPVSPSE